MPKQRRVSSPSRLPKTLLTSGSQHREDSPPISTRNMDNSNGSDQKYDHNDHNGDEKKIHGRSLPDTLQLYLRTKPHALVRTILLCGLAVCLVSAIVRTEGYTSSFGLQGSSSLGGNTRNLDLFQTPRYQVQWPVEKTTGQSLLSQAGYASRPRVVGCYWPEDLLSNHELETYSTTTKISQQLTVERLDMNLVRLYSERFINMSPRSVKAQLHLENSKDYLDEMADSMYDGDCAPQHDWQTKSFPSCNTVHELSALYDMKGSQKKGVRCKYLASGYWRDVWMVRDSELTWEPLVMKTIRYEHEIVDRNFDRHRREAVAMERLTSSPNVLDIYGFCGNTALFEYATGGSLEDAIYYSKEREWTSQEKLVVAYQVAVALADTHNFDKEGFAAVAHTDITPSQYVFVKKYGRFLLNDFNRCRLILWNNKTKEQCGFYVGNNPGTYRAPEEYLYHAESEKVDVYSMGNIFYALLTKKWPFEEIESTRKIQKAVKTGKRPSISDDIVESKDPFTVALLKATNMCWIQDPKQRASARQVEKLIDSELTRLGVTSDAEN